MINADYYSLFYLILVTIFSFVYFRRKNTIVVTHTSLVKLVLLFSIFIGLRPASPVFVDMMAYDKIINNNAPYFTFEIDTPNLLFDNFLNWWSYVGFSSSIFFLIVAIVYFGGIAIACYRFFNTYALFAFMVCLGAFSTFSYGTNGIKAGMAASVFLVGLAYHDNWKVWLPALFVSWGIHHSMMFPIAAFVVTLFYNKPRTYFYFWVFCFLMALMHVTAFQEFFANYTDEKGAEYLLSDGLDWGGKVGFRLDFILYSAMPIIVGYVASVRLKIQYPLFDRILCMYLLCNGIWSLCMYTSYNNRIAYLSWFMFPILLLLPSFDRKWLKSESLKPENIAWLHLGFTWFMELIYY